MRSSGRLAARLVVLRRVDAPQADAGAGEVEGVAVDDPRDRAAQRLGGGQDARHGTARISAVRNRATRLMRREAPDLGVGRGHTRPAGAGCFFNRKARRDIGRAPMARGADAGAASRQPGYGARA